MKKVELVEAVAEKTGLTKADATRAIDATFDAITEALKKEKRLLQQDSELSVYLKELLEAEEIHKLEHLLQSLLVQLLHSKQELL